MATIDEIVVTGDLTLLTPDQRITYYIQVCEAMKIDYRMHPLEYFEQEDNNGRKKLILYALRGATDQLRKNRGIEVKISGPVIMEGVVIYTARAVDKDGHGDESTGVADITNLTGKRKADAFMGAETKAKRRVTLAVVGSGLLDESEVEGMKGQVQAVNPGVGVSTYVPPPAAPEPSSLPATEVFAEAPASTSIICPIPASVEPTPAAVTPPVLQTMDQITARLNTYRRDVLQRGGMVPAKGLGIAAKWSKFLARKIKEKSIVEYSILLKELDEVLAKGGDVGVVAFIDKEIA